MHIIDNGNNEIRGGGVEKDAGRDEKNKSSLGVKIMFRSSCQYTHSVAYRLLELHNTLSCVLISA